MPKITKKEFAIKLLFWLLPWPLSKTFPMSLRIYYWGISGRQLYDWYNYWGVIFSDSIDTYISDLHIHKTELSDSLIKLFNLHKFKYDMNVLLDLRGIKNLFDLYTIGSWLSFHQITRKSGSWESHHDNSAWQQEYFHFTWDGMSWVKDSGGGSASIRVKAGSTWFLDYRPFKIRITYSGPTCDFWLNGSGGPMLENQNGGVTLSSGQVCNLANCDWDIFRLTISDPASEVQISNIEFYA